MVKPSGKIRTITTRCHACQAYIRFDRQPELFDIVTCPECKEEFEVIELSPVQLDWPSDLLGDDEWAIDEDGDHPSDGQGA